MQNLNLFSISLFALLAGLVGCASEIPSENTEYSDLYPVTGVIEFEGKPIPDATIKLIPVKPVSKESLVHNPSAVVNEEGAFQIHTYREQGRGLGAPVGEYRVSVSWLGPLKGLSESSIDELKERLPAKYTKPNTSEITITVKPGENQIPPIQIK